jgi:hypothetical protein
VANVVVASGAIIILVIAVAFIRWIDAVIQT